MAPTLGISPLGTSVRAVGDIAAAADRAGLDAVWAPELYSRSATITVAEMTHRTQRCSVGTGIAYGVGRTPLTLAAEARDLDELADGRFVLGLGNGTRRMISDWHGLDPEAPAVRMEELVPLVRRLWRLHEEPVDHEGRFYRCKLRTTGDVVPPLREAIPIYTAGVNPRMIETAGRVSDGLLGHPLFTVAYLEEEVRPALARGAAKTGRDVADVAVASLVIAVIHEDVERARWEAAAQIAFYCSVKSYGRILEVSGFAAEGARIREAFAARDTDGMVSAVTDDMIDAFAVAGSAEDVRSGLRRYDGLLDQVVLYVPSFRLAPERTTESALSLIEQLSAVTPG
ncbi:MAG: class flavin-dependent oxidoreductase [Conexibacter sp.]|nr:class flavin-dependent oxidoreductase [Conexibacter sp.]